MIGIVIVSHSVKLSDGLKEMADAMSQAPVPIVSAGGMDDPESPLGTDVMRVLNGIRSVQSNEGVLVFTDIGSAKLSAEMAVDLLEDNEREKVRICDAPLVEGVLAAAVHIAAGAGLEDVIKEASGAALDVIALAQGASRDFIIRNRLGLHARPAALFVKTMSRFTGDIQLINLTKNTPPANAKSINGVMLAKVAGNDRVRLITEPGEAEAVFAEMERLIAANLNDEHTATPPASEVNTAPLKEMAKGTLQGIAITPGYAIGPLQHVSRTLPEVGALPIQDPAQEIATFDAALTKGEADIAALLVDQGQHLSDYDRKIFDAHIAYLNDPDIHQRVRDGIIKRKICAAAIWREVIENLQHSYASMTDSRQAARTTDIRDIGQRVLRLLMGEAEQTPIDVPVILAYDDLQPSDVLALAGSAVLGICTATGGKTSHAAILASSLSLPVVFALGEDLKAVATGQDVLLNGSDGLLNVAPRAKDIAQANAQRDAWIIRRDTAEAVRFDAAITSDGHQVRVGANMASAAELGIIANSGAEEIGLLRTEFLFMRRNAPPSEDEQYAIYAAMADGLNGKPLTIRTIDIGGDKPVPYMHRPSEANPNLGWRGLRYSLDEAELFDTQLAGILRASTHGPVRIMFPLVSTLDELRAAKARVAAVKNRLCKRGQSFDDTAEVGIMIEVPAAAEMAEVLAPEVDFFSIGTNDLTQYVMAADRANAKVQALFDPFHPAVLRMVQKSIRAAHGAGIWIGMCGAMAGSPLAAPVLIGMGLNEFSMNPSDVPEFKLTVKDLDSKACKALAEETLKLTSPQAVRACIAAFLEHSPS